MHHLPGKELSVVKPQAVVQEQLKISHDKLLAMPVEVLLQFELDVF